MIIFVGGVIGAGKSSVARGLAEHLGLFYYDVDMHKLPVYREDPDFARNMAEGIPFCEHTRMQVYERVAADFAELASTHEHLVVDETLHRQRPRAYLFAAATRHFGGYVVIWVKARENTILERLTAGAREGHLLKNPVEMHRAFLKEFEPFQESFIVCRNEGALVDTIADVSRLFDNIAVCSRLANP